MKSFALLLFSALFSISAFAQPNCVEVDASFCVIEGSDAYLQTIAEDPFCCDNAWDQLCQTTYISNGGEVAPGCDGFEDILGCTDPSANNFNPLATIDDGSCTYADSCVGNAVEVLILTGQFGNEVSWNLTSNGQEVAGDSGYESNSTFFYDLCLESGCYTFEMYDSFGDGWNGAFFQVSSEGMIIASGTLESGNFGSFNFGIDEPGCDSTNTVFGCTDPAAINYDPEANLDDGSCFYDSVENDLCADATPLVEGTQVVNNTNAVNNEGIWGECWAFGSGEGEQSSVWYSFTTPDEPASIHIEASGDGTFTLTDTQFGLFEECGGEMIYCDGNAGDGLFSAFHFNCGDLEENTTYILMIDGYFGDAGTCILSYDVELGCEIPGCTDPVALNYDPNATVDDGSCIYDEDCTNVSLTLNGPGVLQAFWDLYSDNNYISGGVFTGLGVTYDLCLEDGCYDLLFVNTAFPMDTVSYEVAIGDSLIESGIFTLPTSQVSFGVNTTCEDPIFGCTDPDAINYNPDATIDDGSCEYSPCEGNEVMVIIDTQIWGNEISWNISQDGMEIAGESGYQDNTAYSHVVCLENGCYTFEMFDSFGDGWNGAVFSVWLGDEMLASGTLDSGNYGAIDFGVGTDECGDVEDIYGCTDPEANNYDPNATIDDGSCTYGDCVEVGEAFCVETESDAYDLTIAMDTFCCTTMWDQICQDLYVQNGGEPADGCEIFGCTDPEAINYNPNATVDDGSCEYEFSCSISFTVTPDTTGAQVIWITPSDNILNADSVIWDFGDGQTSSEFYPVYTYQGDGPYTLCVTAFFLEANGGFCEITYCAVLTDEMINPPGMNASGFSINVLNPGLTTSIEPVAEVADLKVWPNPTSALTQIEFSLATSTDVVIELYDLAGKRALQDGMAGAAGTNLRTIDVAGLQPGMYLLRITGEKEQQTTRLVIQ